MSSGRQSRGSERGAVLMHVAVATVGLFALSAVTIDFGVKRNSRVQPRMPRIADGASFLRTILLVR